MRGKLAVLAVTLLGGAAVYVALAIVLPALTKVESATNLPTVEWLPPAASNISFSRNFSNRYFEFDISESEFSEWAKDYSLGEIAKPIQVPRYTRMLDNPSVATSDMDNDPRYTATIANGLADSHVQSNHGGYIIVFDRDQNRGYFKSASR